MKFCWQMIDRLRFSPRIKHMLFVTLMMIISAVLGGAVWFAMGQWMLPQMSWLLCFAGYPAVFVGLFGGILYLMRRE